MRVNTLYSTKEVTTEQGRQMELRYYLIQDIRSLMNFRQKTNQEEAAEENQISRGQSSEERITYGVRIVKNEDGQEVQECLPGLSASIETVECLLRQMIYGLVTPATAMAVVDDWASAQ